MKIKQLIGIIFICLICGGFALFYFFQVHELIILKNSHELVNGVIVEVNHHSTRKSSETWLTCSYIYKGKTYNKRLLVSSGIPFFASFPFEYQKGETLFMLNYEKDIIFPQNNINMEILRRSLYLLLLSIILIVFIVLIKIFLK